MRYDRVQVPLRAFFIITVAAGVFAAVARWLMNRNDANSLLTSIAIGIFAGFATVLIVQHVQVTRLLIALLILFGLSGLWFSDRDMLYGGGFLVGALAAFQGLTILNAMFRLCGLTVSVARSSRD